MAVLFYQQIAGVFQLHRDLDTLCMEHCAVWSVFVVGEDNFIDPEVALHGFRLLI